jgi:hypothetical protein
VLGAKPRETFAHLACDPIARDMSLVIAVPIFVVGELFGCAPRNGLVWIGWTLKRHGAQTWTWFDVVRSLHTLRAIYLVLRILVTRYGCSAGIGNFKSTVNNHITNAKRER